MSMSSGRTLILHNVVYWRIKDDSLYEEKKGGVSHKSRKAQREMNYERSGIVNRTVTRTDGGGYC